MKNTTALLLLSLGLALSSCGGGNQAATPSASSPTKATNTSTDPEDTQAGDTEEVVSEQTFKLNAVNDDIQPQSLTDNPLSATLGVYRSKSGKYKGYTRAKVTFNNTTGAAITGNVHLELGPADKPTELSGPAYDNAKYKITGAKKYAYTVYNTPSGRQCVRLSFDLTLSNGQVISVTKDSPLSVCDMENSEWWAAKNFAIEYPKGVRHATYPMLRMTKEYGMKSSYANADWRYLPDQTTPPTSDEVWSKLNFDITKWGNNFSKPQRVLTGDFDKGYNALIAYGGDCGVKSKPFYACPDKYSKKDIVDKRKSIKASFKEFESYNTLGKRLYTFRFPTYQDGYLPVTPSVTVFTTTGPLGTIALIVSDRGGSEIDPEYFRNLDSGEDYKRPVTVNDIYVYGGFAIKDYSGDTIESVYPYINMYQSNETKGAITINNSSYTLKPLARCGADSDGEAIKTGTFKQNANDSRQWEDEGAVIPEADREAKHIGLEYSIEITDPQGGKKTFTDSGC